MRRVHPASASAQRGAALLLAMIVVALIATAASGMVWQQTRAVSVEAAQRAREDAAWILNGALDWARLILREDLRASSQRGAAPYDSLDEPWAQPLAEARLSSFLAADKDNNADSGPEAFISGAIEDAQARYNLRNLLNSTDPKLLEQQIGALQQLATAAGAPSDAAARIALALRASKPVPPGSGGPNAPQQNPAALPIPPQRLSDLAWQGIEAATLTRLEPYVDLLPKATPINLNTAPREVILAAIDGIDQGTAQRLVAARQRKPFQSLADVEAQLTPPMKTDDKRVSVNSSFFLVSGRLRLDDRVLEERSLLERQNNRVDVLRREKRSFSAPLR